MVKLKCSKRYLVILLSVALGIGMLVNIWAVYLTAYLSPKKATMVYIDVFGEMYWDMVCLIITTVIMLLGLYYVVKGLKYEKK